MNTKDALVILDGGGELVDRQFFYDYDQVADRIDHDPGLDSAETKRAYKAAVSRFLEWLGGREFNAENVKEYYSYLRYKHPNKKGGYGLKPASINIHRAALVWWAKQAIMKAEAAPEPHDFAQLEEHEIRLAVFLRRMNKIIKIKPLKAPDPDPLSHGREIYWEEIQALLRACVTDPKVVRGTRDAALIALAYATAFRQSEIRNLHTDNLTIDEHRYIITIHNTKNKQSRTVSVNDGAAEALADWLTVRGDDPGPVFNLTTKAGELLNGSHLSAQAMRRILKKRIKQAQIKDCTWHDFRRSCITVLNREVGLKFARDHAGHKNIQQTALYDRAGLDERMSAVDKAINVPYVRRAELGVE